jgi:hypothetical protein
MIKPMLSGKGKHEAEDTIFDKRVLAAYLKVSVSTIDKMVSYKHLPQFQDAAGN